MKKRTRDHRQISLAEKALNRQMVDALREVLGMGPLYAADSPGSTATRSCIPPDYRQWPDVGTGRH